MNIVTLLEMARDAMGDRVALGPRAGGRTYAELLAAAGRAGEHFRPRAERVVLVDTNSDAVPITLFGAALAGRPYVPLSFRLADEQLRARVGESAPAVAVVGEAQSTRLDGIDGIELVARSQLLALSETAGGRAAAADAPEAGDFSDSSDSADGTAVILHTSGTTREPKAAVLRHEHLSAYVLSTVDFMSASEDEAALVSVPPYHVAAVSAILSSVFSGRRIVYLESFEPREWVRLVRAESITHAMVVPTMLSRILAVLDEDSEDNEDSEDSEGGAGLDSLMSISYGGGRMPLPVIEAALSRIPRAAFVNAYGLTETSSTVALLGSEEHREAHASDDPAVRNRLTSVGRPLPSIELQIRDAHGNTLGAGVSGEIHVRGEQVSGEYLAGSALGPDGWFPTNDAGRLDDDGFLYVEGRLDDVIVRGAENVSPGAIEDVLLAHPLVADAGVVGVPDPEWGERIAAVVVVRGPVAPQDLQTWVRDRLGSSATPTSVQIRDELPYTETGKLLRRVLRDGLGTADHD